LVTGEVDAIKPYLFSQQDLRAIQVSPSPSAEPSEDRIVDSNMSQIETAVRKARQVAVLDEMVVLRQTRGRRQVRHVAWEMVEIKPTDCIEGVAFVVGGPKGGPEFLVELGDLIRIGNVWKLDGWFTFKRVK